jgi:SAM-dependent methyltransferase
MFHHLTAPNKIKAFQEVHRILKPGGEFHLLDFTRPTKWVMRIISIPIAHMEEADDNIRGLLPEMLQKAGMTQITDTHHFYTIFGELAHLQIRKSL